MFNHKITNSRSALINKSARGGDSVYIKDKKKSRAHKKCEKVECDS